MDPIIIDPPFFSIVDLVDAAVSPSTSLVAANASAWVLYPYLKEDLIPIV